MRENFGKKRMKAAVEGKTPANLKTREHEDTAKPKVYEHADACECKSCECPEPKRCSFHALYFETDGSAEDELSTSTSDSMGCWSDSDEDGAGWSSKKKTHSAYEHPSIFGALKKGFLIEKRQEETAVEITLPIFSRPEKFKTSTGFKAAGVSAKAKASGKAKEGLKGRRRSLKNAQASGGSTPIQNIGAQLFSAKFKYTAADIPGQLFKRASAAEVLSFEDQKEIWREEFKRREKEREKERMIKDVGDDSMVKEGGLDLDQEHQTRKKSEESVEPGWRVIERVRENIGRKDTDKLLVEVEFRKITTSDKSSNVSKKKQELVQQDGVSLKSCWREFERKIVDDKGDWKSSLSAVSANTDNSGKKSKGQNRARKKDKESEEGKEVFPVLLENGRLSEQIKTLDTPKVPELSQTRSIEAAELPLNTASSSENQPILNPVEESKSCPDEVSKSTSMVLDRPLQLYKKEEEPPVVTSKETKRKSKVKKIKSSKVKKVHLFRDGFTLPSAAEPDDDSDQAPPLLKLQGDCDGGRSPCKATELLDSEIASAKVSGPEDSDVTEDLDKLGRHGGLVQAPGLTAKHPTNIQRSSSGAGSTMPVSSSVSSPNSLPTAFLSLRPPATEVVTKVLSSLPPSEGLGSPSHSTVGPKFTTSTRKPTSTLQRTAQPSCRENLVHTLRPNREWWSNPVSTSYSLPPHSSNGGSCSANVTATPGMAAGSKFTTGMINATPTSIESAVSYLQLNSASSFSNIAPDDLERSNFNMENAVLIDQSTLWDRSNPTSVTAPAIGSCLPISSLHRPVVTQNSNLRKTTVLSADVNPEISRFPMAPVSQVHPSAQSLPATSTFTGPPRASEIQLSASNSFTQPQMTFLPPPYTSSRSIKNSIWTQPGFQLNGNEPGLQFPSRTLPSYFGQVISCNNHTLTMYKQMGCFRIASKHLLKVSDIAPGSCALFLYNIETHQLHGVYQSSSYGLQETTRVYAISVTFDLKNDYKVPLSGMELDSGIPNASLVDGKPVYLQLHLVKQLMTLFAEKNTSRPVSPVPPSGRHPDVKAPKVEQPLMTSGSTHTADDNLPGLSDFSSLPVSKSFSSSIQNPFADASVVVNGGLFIKPTSANELTTTEANEEPWSPTSGVKLLDYEQPAATGAPPSHVLPCPTLPIRNYRESNTAKLEVKYLPIVPKVSVGKAAPSPMELWPHLFPKVLQTSTLERHRNSESEQHKTNPGTSFQPEGKEVRDFLPHLSAFGPESTEPSAALRGDPDAECNNFTPISESSSRSAVPRPKQAYNPLAAEQGRQKQLVEGKRPLVSDVELQQSHRSRDNFFQATSTATAHPAAEQVAVSTASVSAEPVLPLVFPWLYQVVSPGGEHLVRDRPSETGKEVGSMKHGAIVEAWGQQGNWLRECTPENTVRSSYSFYQISVYSKEITEHVKSMLESRLNILPNFNEAWSLVADESAMYLQRSESIDKAGRMPVLPPRSDLTPEVPTETTNTSTSDIDQTHVCCYCFSRPADHLIIDCRHLGPCLDCTMSKKIELCGQPNCGTRISRLLRLFL